MKRIIAMFLALICCACLILPAAAHTLPTAENDVHAQRIDFEDGSYCIIGEAIETYTAASEKKTGQKAAIYYNDNDEKIFAVVVRATFTYDGTSASADSAEASVLIYDENATYISKDAYTSGATAYASGTVKYKITRTLPVSLTCSKTGVLS